MRKLKSTFQTKLLLFMMAEPTISLSIIPGEAIGSATIGMGVGSRVTPAEIYELGSAYGIHQGLRPRPGPTKENPK